MAKFGAKGIEGLELSMKEFAAIPDEIVEEMLTEAGKVVAAAHKRKLQELGLVKTGKLLNSIAAHSKAGNSKNDFKRYVLIYPEGKHGTRNRRLVVKKYKRSKHGRTYTVGGDIKDVTNNDVGFIHEFGAPNRGIKAKQWMRKANEECADDVTRAEFEVYEKWLKSIDL